MHDSGQLAQTFVRLADTLVSGYDVSDFLYDLCLRAQKLLHVDASGVLLAGERLEVAAASTESMREIELFELQSREGPCADAYASGEQVLVPELKDTEERWPGFTPRALEDGYRSVWAFPLRLRNERIGAMNLFRREPGPLPAEGLEIGQALADIATIGILQERAVADAELLSSQLQYALNSRVRIEQAKGMLARTHGVSMREAFEMLRTHARSDGRRIVEVAGEVIEGTVELGGS